MTISIIAAGPTHREHGLARLATAVGVLVLGGILAASGFRSQEARAGRAGGSEEPSIAGTELERLSAEREPQQDGDAHGLLGGLEESCVLYIGKNLIRKATWSSLSTEWELISRERSDGPYGDEWSTNRQTYSCSFKIVDISSRSATDFLICGEARNGDDVLELWELVDPQGSYSATRTVALTGVGTPASPTLTTPFIPGGVYIPPSARTAIPLPQKTELFRGDLGGVLCGLLEMDGRYLMVARSSYPELVQLLPPVGNQPYWTPGVSWDSQDVLAADSPYGFSQGRRNGASCAILTAEYAADVNHRTYLWDADNDGVFESVENYDTWINDPYESGVLDELNFMPEQP